MKLFVVDAGGSTGCVRGADADDWVTVEGIAVDGCDTDGCLAGVVFCVAGGVDKDADMDSCVEDGCAAGGKDESPDEDGCVVTRRSRS